MGIESIDEKLIDRVDRYVEGLFAGRDAVLVERLESVILPIYRDKLDSLSISRVMK